MNVPSSEPKRHVYGPVPSRRLGRSLGIDPIPFKTCNWNCVYCQLGRTAPLRTERREWIPAAEILADVDVALTEHGEAGIDWVTFVGSGEPTLHSGLGRMIRAVRARTTKPIAVITNGSLLHLPEVRDELAEADAVLPSLDAGSQEVYRRVNRAAPSLPFETLAAGLEEYARTTRGDLWVEVMLVKGLNDSEEALADIAAVLRRVAPDEVHLNLPTRPPSEPWVEPPDADGIVRALGVLGAATAHVVRPALDASLELPSDGAALGDALVGVIERHPLGDDDLAALVPAERLEEVRRTLERLAGEGHVRGVRRYGRRFWCPGGGRFRRPEDGPRHDASSGGEGR